jgi:glycine cleavage system H protein
MSGTPQDLRYTPEHEWVDGASPARVGITHVAVDQLKDIVYVDLPQPGTPVAGGQTCGEIESVKSVADLYSPVTGTVVEVNQAVVDAPELINDGPYEAWLFTVEVPGGTLPDTLLTAEEYDQLVAAAEEG